VNAFTINLIILAASLAAAQVDNLPTWVRLVLCGVSVLGLIFAVVSVA
jgi:hypothetical protein